MSEEINSVIGALDINIKNLEEADEINLKDVQVLLIDLFGVIRDLWEQLGKVFAKFNKINDIEKSTAKGEKYKENNKVTKDIERLYL